MKRIIAFLLGLTLLLGLAACGASGVQNDAPSDTSMEQTPPAPERTPTTTPDSSSTPDTEPEQDSGKVLVAYFSATNNTEGVAQVIAEALGADLFELEPVEPYTSADLNYNDSTSRVSREHDDPSLQNVELEAVTPENWEEYDTVFIGYPIWWHAAAWPVNSFVAENNFSGKTVIPFCTSGSSSLGDSGELLAELAGSGDWQEGQRFSGKVSADTVMEWLDSLELS